MKLNSSIVFAITLILVVSTTAYCVEITPFTGYRIGGSFENDLTGIEMDLDENENYGVVLNFDIAPDKQYEIYYSHQATRVQTDPAFILSPDWNIDVDYLHIGGVSLFNEGKAFRPFVAGGLGMTHLDPEQLSSETRFSLSLGGGGKLYMTDNLGLRFEARSFWTLIESNGALFCNNGGCRIFVEGDTWWQFETNLGVFFRF